MSDWQIGDKALCIRNSSVPMNNPLYIKPNGNAIKDTLYLVDGIYVDCTGSVGLIIAAVPCLWAEDGEEVGHLAHRFRKVVPRSERMTKAKSDSLTALIKDYNAGLIGQESE